MKVLGAIFSLLTAAAGWHYLFYSQAAHRLGAIEEPASNSRRIRLRRVNGVVMMLLALFFVAGFWSVDWQLQPAQFMFIWIMVFVLLLAVMCLALADVRLTLKLRRDRQEQKQ